MSNPLGIDMHLLNYLHVLLVNCQRFILSLTHRRNESPLFYKHTLRVLGNLRRVLVCFSRNVLFTHNTRKYAKHRAAAAVGRLQVQK